MSFTDVAELEPEQQPSRRPPEPPIAPPTPSFNPAQPNVWDPRQTQPERTETGGGQVPDTGPSTRVAPDQTAIAQSFTSGTPTPPQPLLPPPSGPQGPFGPPAFRGAARQTYIPSPANRDPHQWGSDRDYPMKPAAWEIPGIYRGVGAQLAQWGPGSIAPYAAMMGQMSGAYSKAYIQGQEFRARQVHERMVWAAEETERRYRDMLREYGAIHAVFGDDPKNADKLHQALMNAAMKYSDEHMKSALAQTGPESAQNLLKWYDAKFGDVRVSNRERERQEKEQEGMNPWLQHPTSHGGLPAVTAPQTDDTGGGEKPAEEPTAPAPPVATPNEIPTEEPKPEGGATPEEPAPATLDWGTGDAVLGEAAPQQPGRQQLASLQPEQITPPADEGQQGEPSPDELRGLRMEASPTQLAQAQQQQQSDVPRSAVMDAARQYTYNGSPLNENALRFINQKAQDGLMGRLTTAELNKMQPPIRAFVQQRYAEMASRLDRIAGSDLTGAAALKAIRDVSPQIANGLESVALGEREPPKGAALDRPPWNRAFALLKKIDPSFTVDNFATRRKTKLDFTPGGSQGKKVVSVGTAFRLGEILKGELDKGIPGVIASKAAAGAIPLVPGRYQQSVAGAMEPGSVERLNKIRALAREFIGEAESALAGGGAPRQTERLLQEKAYDPAEQNVEAIKAQLESTYTALKSRLQELKGAYQAGTGWGADKMLELFSTETREGVTGLERGAAPDLNQGLPPGVSIRKIK